MNAETCPPDLASNSAPAFGERGCVCINEWKAADEVIWIQKEPIKTFCAGTASLSLISIAAPYIKNIGSAKAPYPKHHSRILKIKFPTGPPFEKIESAVSNPNENIKTATA